MPLLQAKSPHVAYSLDTNQYSFLANSNNLILADIILLPAMYGHVLSLDKYPEANKFNL
jgi:hypothetical protein